MSTRMLCPFIHASSRSASSPAPPLLAYNHGVRRDRRCPPRRGEGASFWLAACSYPRRSRPHNYDRKGARGQGWAVFHLPCNPRYGKLNTRPPLAQAAVAIDGKPRRHLLCAPNGGRTCSGSPGRRRLLLRGQEGTCFNPI